CIMEIVVQPQQQGDAGFQKKKAFLVSNLAVKIPERKSASLPKLAEVESDLGQGLGKDALKQIAKDTKRLPPFGHGSFGDVLKKAEDLAQIWEAFQSDSKVKVKTGVFSSKKMDVSPEQMEIQFHNLYVEAKKWADSQPEPGDDKRTAKQQACQEFMKLAKQGLTALKMQKLDELQAQIQDKKGTPDVVDQFRELDAQILCLSDRCAVEKAGSGTSDVRLLKLPNGEVAYAFKSVAKESDQMASPKGAGALRECL